jgi:hypothetical protein
MKTEGIYVAELRVKDALIENYNSRDKGLLCQM